jgi:DNA-binding transcriptional MerR regulator
MSAAAYTLADLCDLADVTPRTVRYYIAQGLLRSPGGSGPGARYDDGHLARLRLIRRLQREHLPLAEIRSRLAALSDEEVISEAEVSAQPPADSALDYVRTVLGTSLRGAAPAAAPVAPPAVPAPPSRVDVQPGLLRVAEMPAPGYTVEPPTPVPDRSHWERYALAPDIELHVRRPLTRSQNRAVVRLLEAARQLLEEDQP